jgi:hypothetical protein
MKKNKKTAAETKSKNAAYSNAIGADGFKTRPIFNFRPED